MNILKKILNYSAYAIIAFFFAFAYMRIILGAKPEEPTSFLMHIFYLIYQFAFVRIGLIIGSIITLLYILIDVYYLNKKLKNSANSISIRILIIFVIAIIVAATHYILEKVIDVI